MSLLDIVFINISNFIDNFIIQYKKKEFIIFIKA